VSGIRDESLHLLAIGYRRGGRASVGLSRWLKPMVGFLIKAVDT